MQLRRVITIFCAVLILVMPDLLQADDDLTKAESYYQEAEQAVDDDDLDEAAKLLEKALELDPDNCAYHFARGDIQGARAQKASVFTKISKARSCKSHWERAIELCPDSVKYYVALMQYHLQAPGIAGGSDDEAGRLLTEIYAMDSTEGRLAEAAIARDNEDFEGAERMYLAIIESGADTLAALRALGNMSNYDVKNYEKAGTYYERLLAIDPEDWGTVYQMGRVCVLAGVHPHKAVQCFRRYVNHPGEGSRPSHAAAYWRMGMAYELLNFPDSAVICYENSLQLEPDFKDAKNALKKLK
jgi:tetratricopeptide (TPR) repeat protein